MVSKYFNNSRYVPEQQLVEGLVVEAISIYGLEVHFIPRTINDKDDILGEDALSSYDSYYMIDAYPKNVDRYEGEGTFLSKFNLEIRDQTTFTIARRTFEKEVGSKTGAIRPLEGDLIWSDVFKRLFIIKYVDNEANFHQFGAYQVWDLTCEVFEYSNEIFNTGLPQVDEIQTKYSARNITDDAEFEAVFQDIFADNKEIEDESTFLDLSDWSPNAPFE